MLAIIVLIQVITTITMAVGAVETIMQIITIQTQQLTSIVTITMKATVITIIMKRILATRDKIVISHPDLINIILTRKKTESQMKVQDELFSNLQPWKKRYFRINQVYTNTLRTQANLVHLIITHLISN